MEPTRYELTVLNDIQERLGSLTDEQFNWGVRRVSESKIEPNEKPIGEITSRATQALYVLSVWLKAQAGTEYAQSFVALDPIAAEEHLQKYALLAQLGDVIREVFWTQAKWDLGFYRNADVGVRDGFILVEREAPRSPFQGVNISAMLPPGFRPPGGDE